VASSVTRFDTPKINSPADPPRGLSNELGDEGWGALSLSLSLSVFRRDHETPRERGT